MTRTIESERNEALLDWYEQHHRILPWRTTRDPYAILVSEIMLQQTQAERVTPHYQRFLSRFPTIETLAAAPFADVATEWSGLGYNTRAKRLHQAAAAIASSGWPDTVEGLEALPGVGPYTARAVAAFAFGEGVAAIDTNVKRVLSRWHGEVLAGTPLERAAAVDIADDAATWNQAVMDLGATVCRPRRPSCDVCPVEQWCAGPGTYEPPRPQPRFAGSAREVRGAIVRRLVAGPADLDDLVDATGVDDDRIDEAVDALIEDGLVVETEGGFALTD